MTITRETKLELDGEVAIKFSYDETNELMMDADDSERSVKVYFEDDEVRALHQFLGQLVEILDNEY
jgi:hypothetical protein